MWHYNRHLNCFSSFFPFSVSRYHRHMFFHFFNVWRSGLVWNKKKCIKWAKLSFLSQLVYKYACFFVTALTSSAKCDLVLLKRHNYKMNKMVPKVLHVAVGHILCIFHVCLLFQCGPILITDFKSSHNCVLNPCLNVNFVYGICNDFS